MDETDDYYIWKLNSYVPVSSKKELVNFLYDHKKDVKRFMRKDRIGYKNDRDNTMIQVATYFCSMYLRSINMRYSAGYLLVVIFLCCSCPALHAQKNAQNLITSYFMMHP